MPVETFDLAYSSLALHCVPDLARLANTVHRSLVDGGSFVFSVEHPIHTAPSRAGWIDVEGRSVWPLDGSLAEGPRTVNWFTDGVVKNHRTIASHVAMLLDAGFHLSGLVEWGPSPEQLAQRPEWATDIDRPPFLLVGCVKS